MEPPSITCPRCQWASYHPKDIEYRYCGHCRKFHDDINPQIWCNTHKRPAELCKVRGGIMLPCEVVDLTNLLEIEYQEDT